MTVKLLVLLALAIFGWIAGLSAKRRRREALEEVGAELDLAVHKDGLTGELDGYGVRLRRTRRKEAGRRGRAPVVELEVDLHTAPDELQISTETLATRAGKLVGFHDLHVGDAVFDETFHVQTQNDQLALSWLTSERRGALLQLHETVRSATIDDGALRVELAGELYDKHDTVAAARYAAQLGAWMDDPKLETPKLPIATRVRVSVWPMYVLAGLVIAVVVAFFAWVKVSANRQAAEHAALQQAETAYTSCVANLEPTFDVDLTTCDDALAAVKHESVAVDQARRRVAQLRLRQTSRVALDEEATRLALAALQNAESLREDAYVSVAWDAGLLEDAYQRDRGLEPRQPTPTIAFALYTRELDSLDFEGKALDALNAWRCAFGKPDIRERAPRYELETACSEVRNGTFYNWHKRDPESVLAALEVEPDKPQTTHPMGHRVQLARAAFALANGKHAALDEVQPDDEPLDCAGSWHAGPGYGVAETWEKAAPLAGRWEEEMWLLAGLQHAASTDHARALEAVAHITANVPESVCAAQVEVAAGSPKLAVERLRSLAPAEPTGRFHMTLAEAYFALHRFDDAAASAGSASTTLRGAAKQRAVVLWIASRLGASQQLDLSGDYGEVPKPDELDNDPVQVARWFAQKKLDETSDDVDRWAAPSMIPLIPGSEPVMFFIAAGLAPAKSADYWLDVLMPTQFDPLGAATGRRLAATMRGDTDAEALWSRREGSITSQLRTANQTRVARRARQIGASDGND